MYELVYNSIADPQDIDEADLMGILAASREHNRVRGITGFLLYHRGEFVQLLEGERETVRQVYFDYITRDPRHTNVTLCWEFEIERRSFPDWSMAFYRPGPAMYGKDARLDGYIDGGVAALQLAGPSSAGRQLLFNICTQIDPAHFTPALPSAKP